MISAGMKASSKPPALGDGSGLVLFDEYLNDEDFLEFLIEWSDSIVQKDAVNPSPGGVPTPKRKIDQVNLSPQVTARHTYLSTQRGQIPGVVSGVSVQIPGVVSGQIREQLGQTNGQTGRIGVEGDGGRGGESGGGRGGGGGCVEMGEGGDMVEADGNAEANVDLDAQLVKLPIGIFEAFNTGDLQHLRNLIKEGMTPDCLFKTMMIDQPLIGRHVYSEFWSKLSVSHPDMVFILKKVRVTDKIGECKCLKFNYFFTGTNTFPGATETYYYNNDDYLTKNLDRSKYSEKEKNAVNLLVAQHRAHGTPYVAFGRGSGCYKLDEDNKVNSVYFEWKLTSICPPVGESS